jgi:hypothetical protein
MSEPTSPSLVERVKSKAARAKSEVYSKATTGKSLSLREHEGATKLRTRDSGLDHRPMPQTMR